MRPLSEATSRVASKNFSRKYIALGRLIKQWDEIMGEEFADKAQPLKLRYRKAGKNQKSKASLDIATTASHATILNYQKGLIMERINTLFGGDWIEDIRFVVSSDLSDADLLKPIIPKPLSGQEKKYLHDVLDQIEDPDIKDKLETLGQAILMDKK